MNQRLPYLREKTSKLTLSSGVYIMKNKSGNIIYIGKAKSLRKRVSSYFREHPDHTPKVSAMVENVYDYEFIVTDSEYEALILECSLIKQHQPKYNILLKDDKGYHYIRISDDEYPKITDEKNTSKSGTYLGPYMSGFVTKETVREVNKIFMLPTCNKKFPNDFGKSRPCLNYSIKTCMGVCTGKVSKSDYVKSVNQAVDFIKSDSNEIIKKMEAEMNQYAENLEFEKAMVIRDRISAIKKAGEKQKIINSCAESADVIATAEFNSKVFISVLVYRENRLCDKKIFETEKETDEDTISLFMEQYYSHNNDIPKIIITEHLPDDSEIITRMIEEQGGNTKILAQQKGKYSELLKLAKENCIEYVALKNSRTGKEISALEQLGKSLGLEKTPKYIEAYDISNLSSESMVAGMIVFENGRPLKKAYKHFNIKTQNIQNDYGSMAEVLERRLMHIINQEGDEFFRKIPDLILLDGGKGHVSTVEPIIRKLGLSIPVFGMVKDSKHRTRAIATDGKEIRINNMQAVFSLVTNIQDEVHRYSVSYMHSQHKKQTYTSEFTKIKGIGEKKSQKLMQVYKTMENLKKASAEELAHAIGISMETALNLWNFIHE